MADLRDEHGNPIQLTDQFGKPVQLTDEYGNPMHLTGVATSPTARTGTAAEVAAKVAEELSHEQEPAPQPARPHVQQEHLAVPKKYSSSPLEHVNPTAGAALKHYSQPPSAVPPLQPEQVRRSGSSGSSSSSEDDGQGGRRKKGSLKEKIMGAFGSHKDKGSHDHTVAATTTTTTHSKMSTTTVPEHEKKGFMEKIKEKLPGHHHDHQGKGTTN